MAVCHHNAGSTWSSGRKPAKRVSDVTATQHGSDALFSDEQVSPFMKGELLAPGIEGLG